MKKTEILATLGPNSTNIKTIRRLESLGVDLFRINLSHTKVQDLSEIIERIRSMTSVPICLDSEGAQVRTGDIQGGHCIVHANRIIRAVSERTPGNSYCFNLYPLNIIDEVKIGDFISIDFNTVLTSVINIGEGFIELRVLIGGKIGKNKAVTINRNIPMDPYTPKDLAAFEIGKQYGIKHFALSFAHTQSEVTNLREILGEDSFIISKIECEAGVKNLKGIAESSNAILIDRGDLSREVPIEKIPKIQKQIIKVAQESDAKVYVATNLLESMIEAPVPTRAEVNDIYNTLMDGADGLVLAAETAIGKYPALAVEMVNRVVHEFHNEKPLLTNHKSFFRPSLSFLVKPHGGTLIENYSELDESKLNHIIEINEFELLDSEQLAIGTYSPLSGFMNEKDLQSVLSENKLSSGVVWTMPVLLSVSKEVQQKFKEGDKIGLRYTDGNIYTYLEFESSFLLDKDKVSEQWFGTTSKDHPGVMRFMNQNDYFLSGKVVQIKSRKGEHSNYFYSPRQSRYIFEQKGWSTIVAFHTRNVAHRAHEHIQKLALKRVEADGLYITPVLGPKKSGDFKTEPILKGYQSLIDFGHYDDCDVMLGSFLSYPRYCGPREAIFTAICRKNMGCSHIIIGRDHTGVGTFYEKDANFAMFNSLKGSLGITPLFFSEYAYNTSSKSYEESSPKSDSFVKISGTALREKIQNSEEIPTWFMRDVVQETIKKMVDRNEDVFFQ
jgi:pyruvate kinase